MATLKDIAGVTGISISTISRVLNRDETISVTPQTSDKIFAAAKALGYVPSRSRAKAESAAPARRMGIAQMLEMEQILEDPYYLYLKSALEKVCFSKGIETTNLFRDETGHFICQGESELDGVFAIGSFTSQEIADFRRYSAHVVFVDSSPDDEHYFAAVPNFRLGVRQALHRLLEAGHRRIGFIGSQCVFQAKKDRKLDDRLYYFQNILKEAGVFDPAYVLDSAINAAAGFAVMTQALEQWQMPPTALFIASDAIANGVLRALERKGISVPGEMSVIAFHDTPLSSNATPPLSSVRVLQNEIAAAAYLAMEASLAGSAYPFKTVVPCIYVERESIGTPGTCECRAVVQDGAVARG